MVLFLHNRYRTEGGEERVVADLRALIRGRMGEEVFMLDRDSAGMGRGLAAAGLLAGGLRPDEVAAAVRQQGARVLHAHNLLPAFGWRGLAAGRRAGARVVLHLHQYRLVCAIGVCFRDGQECTRCHGRNTLPGVRLNCRGSGGEALAYGTALALWQRRTVEQADVILVPSAFAAGRLRELGVPLEGRDVRVLAPPVAVPAGQWQPDGSGYALVASRLSVEKGVDVAIEACAVAGLPLAIAGDGPQRGELEGLARAVGGDVRFLGSVGREELERLRAGAAVAVVPSRSAETFGLALAEAMVAGVPAVASRVGALPELLDDEDGLVAPGDPGALASAIQARAGDGAAGARGRVRVLASCSPDAVAARLARIYDGSPEPDGA
jgi:glycosyltransferase involved in cell wall biosynthesis